ncbi:NADH-quinone oxidoreductase subunit C [bacterium]|nr:NADH-quinone oxidoreductase subunit C [bacterium]
MDYFDFSTCVDHPPDRLDLVYSMYSTVYKHRIQLKVVLDRQNPCVPTVSHLWVNANWNEREMYDLFGVFFPGHKDLRRLMMPDDWEGHPLRKDYAHPNLVVRPD